jgi:hypothetical protein
MRTQSVLALAALLALGAYPAYARSSGQAPGYSPPAELTRHALQVTQLSRSSTAYVSYSWSAEAKEVRFNVFWRESPGATWQSPVERVETVPYYEVAGSQTL